MPNYDYQCSDCGHHFEIFQSMNDAKLEECPECGGSLERLIGAGAGMIFKGSGFYITDYRTESYKQGKKGETSDKPATGKDGGSSSKEPKPASPAPSSGKSEPSGTSKPAD